MKIKYMAWALLGALAACDDYNDQFDFLDSNGITDVKNLEVALGGSDYATIADLEANQNLAIVKQDQLGGNYVEALAAVKENKYFTADATAADYVPAWLLFRYPEATDGSRIKVSYNEYRATPAYMSELEGIEAYTLTESDYKSVWGDGKQVLYLTPQSEAKLDGVLKEAFPDAASGDKVLVHYAYDDVEPSIGGSEEEPIVAYVPVTAMAEEGGKYIIAAKFSDEKYYPFGNTSSWGTYTYNYFTPTVPLSFEENGTISLKQGEVEGMTVEKGTDGYLVKDCSGYYLYLYGTSEKFNRITSVPTSAGEWSFTSNADGTVTMINIEKERTVKLTVFNSNPSYGAYASSKYIYFEDACASLETTLFTMKDVELPKNSKDEVVSDHVWSVDTKYKYWKGSAYVSEMCEAESYLVSTEIDLSKATAPILTWEEAINKTGTQSVDKLAVWVSTDYAGDVSAATWTLVESKNRASGINWTFAYPEADLSAYKGQKIYVAFKYVSSTAAAPTWEICNVAIKEPNYWDVNLFKGMTQSEMDGTVVASGVKAVRAADVKANTSVLYTYDGSAWKVYEPSGATLAVVDPATYQSVGADYLMRPETQIPVFLTKNYPYATNGTVMAVVYTNVENEIVADEYKYASGVWTKLTGTTTKKLTFQMTDGVWAAGANSYYENTLLGDEGGFTACNIMLSGLTYVWTNKSSYGWTGSAYASSKAYEAEAWLVSPAIFLEDSEAPVVTFDEAANYMGGSNVDAVFTVWVTKDAEKFSEDNPDVSGCNWDKLTLDTRASGDSWTYVNVGQIDLSAYNGETIRIALKYTSSSSAAGTWEVKNFSVAERSE